MELISREEVIKLLNGHIAYLYDEDEKAYMSVVVVKEDIKRLSPIEEIPTDYAEGYKKGYIDGGVDALMSRPKGKWILQNDGLYHCSECSVLETSEREGLPHKNDNYCRNCGAEMENRDV